MGLIPVTDLKQWAYCPRIVYYHRVLPGVGRPTAKMQEAVAAQEMIESLELRRSLRAYGWTEARRRFGVWLQNPELGLAGKIDLLLETENAVAVVDFKLTSGEPGENHRMQLTGYALLAAAEFGKTVDQGFLYRIPDDRIFAIPITQEYREQVRAAVRCIREVERDAWYPLATAVRSRCSECEYANFCGDIW